jgi:hypothetical protein
MMRCVCIRYVLNCGRLVGAGMQLYLEHLHSARGESAVAKALAETQRGTLKTTALHYAADSASDAAVSLLLEQGALPVC